jgi:hypothetical protein
MCLPVYRRTVEAIDTIFQRLAGELTIASQVEET